MCDFVQWVLVLLLAATAVRAQPPAPREPRQRSITLSGDLAEPLPVVHVARGVRTVLLFDSPVKGGESELDPTRLRLVEAGRWVIILEPLGEPAPGEPWTLRVAWEAEQAPGWAGFTLVSHPDEVDTVLTVTRRARLPEPDAVCQEQLTRLEARCGASSLLGFAQGSSLDEQGLSTVALKPAQPGPRGDLSSNKGLVHRGQDWALVVVRIENDGGSSWMPQAATLTSTRGQQVKVLAMTSTPEEVAPHAGGRIRIETELPREDAGSEFVLEVRGVDGRTFTHPAVKLPPPPQRIEP